MMRKIVLFDLPEDRLTLRPFSFTRPLSAIRVGMLSIAEKWQHYFPGSYTYLTCSTLHIKYTPVVSTDAYYINGALCPDSVLAEAIARLKYNEVLLSEEGGLIAFRGNGFTSAQSNLLERITDKKLSRIIFFGELTQIKHTWDIFLCNAQEIERDWAWYTKGRVSKPIVDPHTIVYHEKDIFIEEGLAIHAAYLNAEQGPIYIGKNVSIAEGAVLRGPLAICNNVQVQPHTYIYGGSTIGPFSAIGGEVSNSILLGYNDKPYQGFIGHTVIGEWGRLAAGSSLARTFFNGEPIVTWDFTKEAACEEKSLSTCGFFMGDYSQFGGNATIEPGSVIGVAAHVAANQLAMPYVPSFTYSGTNGKLRSISLVETLERLSKLMSYKHQVFLKEDKAIVAELFKTTAIHRTKAMMDHAIFRDT
ncbi:MAG: putative sugar nucleotidyl transferase [Candidatus Cardinium sp.]|nr:putative sugar nucleotidyl transferase [Candidatus Cardinium sp.]